MNTKADALGFALMEHLGPAALTGGTMSVHDAFVLGWNAAPQAAAINAEFLEALTLMMFDKHGKEWFDSTVDQGVWDDRLERGKSIARAAIARATGAAA